MAKYLTVAVSLALPHSLASFPSCDNLLALLYIVEIILGIDPKLWPSGLALGFGYGLTQLSDF